MSELYVHATHQGAMRISASIRNHHVLMDYPMLPEDATEGPTPLELLLASLAGCAGNTLALLLRKGQHSFEGIEVATRGQRREEHPTAITDIHMEFLVKGKDLDSAAIRRAVDIAEARICPVWAMLKPSTSISTSLRILEA